MAPPSKQSDASQRGPDEPTVTSQRRAGEAPPPVLERYRIVGQIGRGGLGAVYEAHDELLDRRVALKLLHRRATGASPADERSGDLLREAQALAKLNHPNVVSVYDVGTVNDDVFLCMELVRGTTLKDYLKASRPGWRRVVEIFDAAAAGLMAAHEAGLVHRDFKPSNVLLGDDGRVLVSDFGLARAASVDPDGVVARAGAESVTVTGPAEGTPRYMAPEQRAGADVTPASDQFSLCVALYEALYGAYPFEDGAREPAVPAVSDVPASIGAAVATGLAYEADERHASLAVLRDGLVVADAASQRGGRWAWVAVALCTAVAVALWATRSEPQQAEVSEAPEVSEPAEDQVLERARASIAEAAANGDTTAVIEAHFAVANQLQIEGRDRAALTIVRDGLALQRTALGPDDGRVAQSEFWLAYLHVRVGEPAAGIALAEHATQVAEASGDISATAEARALWARCLYESGQVEAGKAQGARALAEAEQSGNTRLATQIRTYGKTHGID